MKTKQYWIDQIGEGWTEILKPLLKSDYMEKLTTKLTIDYALYDMYPERQENIFKAFKLCPWEDLRIVVIGTEPSKFSGTGALAFSDSVSTFTNPSVELIRRCVSNYNQDLGFDFDTTFKKWAKQGILMLNRSLTCKREEIKTHREEWKKFFGSILYVIEKYKPGTIFLLWGKEAGKYAELLSKNHHVFTWEHPMVADKKRKNWECPNFAQVDVLLNSLYGGTRKINW